MTDGFPVPGQIFEGRYRISRLIGSGGFARVYLAIQEDLGREVAIKVLMPASNSDGGSHYSEKLVRRFNQEARLVSRLRDPHTITMFDYGETPQGLLYMVFEYVEGRSLSEAVHKDGALGYERVVKVLEATLSSLQEAHAFGVLHRDIKPGNIMLFDYLGRPDQVKLLDFGIAKSVSDKVPGKDITADGALVGTPRYMSPEQIRGQEMSPASDIYALGLVAFEMLTGYKAIDSNSSVTIIGKQLDSTPFVVPADIDVPPGLKAIVNKMMAKDRDKRFQDAEEVLQALRDFREGKTLEESSSTEDHFETKKTIPLPEISVERGDMTLSPATTPSDEFMPRRAAPGQDPQPADAEAAPEPAPTSKNGARTTAAAAGLDPDAAASASTEKEPNPVKMLALFGLVALLLIGGGVVAALSLGNSDATEATDDELAMASGDASAPAEAQTTEPEVAELAVEETTPDQADPVEEAPTEPRAIELLVATRPVAAQISVNGESHGDSPAQISLTDADFPVEVVATIDGKEVAQTLPEPASSVIVDVTDIAPREEPKAAKKTKPRARTKPRPRPKPKATEEPAKFKPMDAKADEKNDEGEDKSGLSLPALDL